MKRIHKQKVTGRVIIMLNTDSDAFQSDPGVEVASILEDYAEKVKSRGLYPSKLRDTNGNTVGDVKVAKGDSKMKRVRALKRRAGDPDIEDLINKALPASGWQEVATAARMFAEKFAENLQSLDPDFDFEMWKDEIREEITSLIEADMDITGEIFGTLTQYGYPDEPRY